MKRILITLLAVVALLSSVAVVANAISINVTTSNYGEMLPTDAKFTKTTTTVRAYGNYDYLNFYIDSVYDDKYFFYEIYADEEMKKPVASDYVYCETRGKYTYSPWIKLKGVFKTGTYYGVTYAAEIDDEGNVSVSQSSFREFKFVVNRTTEFKRQIVLLKNPTNTVNGPTIKWYKLSNNVSKYVVYRRSMTGTKWYKVATVNGNTYSYTDKSLKNKNAKYIYTVKAIDKKGVASRYQYNGTSVLFAKAPVVSSVATASDNRVQVKWNRTSSLAVYRVYRSENGGSWKLIKNNYNSNVFYDTTAKNGVTYKYTVRAVIPTAYGNAISSYYSGKATTFTAAPALNPVEVSENGLKITWGAVEGATAYTVYRKSLENGASWGALKKVEAGVTEYVDTTANENSAFIYTVRSEGKTSRGSYSGSGVEYFTLAQPEFTTTLNEHIVHIEWEPVENAEGYYILCKDGAGNWYIYQNIAVGNKSDIYISTTYAEYEFTVQAYRGDKTSTYKEDVEKIEYWATATAKYEIYEDVIYFRGGGRSDTTYKLYKKLASEPDSEYEVIATAYCFSVGRFTLSDETEVLYDTPYVYQVRMTYNGKEQTENIQTINLTKYSPEKYIESFDAIPEKVNGNYVFGFDYKLKDAAKDFDVKIYGMYDLSDNPSYSGTIHTGWAELSSTDSWEFYDWTYNLANLKFSCVVSDENGSTPIAGFVIDESIR